MGRRGGEGHNGQAAIGGRGEEPQRIPSSPPTVADAVPALQDDKVDCAWGERVTDCDPRLPAANDDGLESLYLHRRTRLKARLSIPPAAEIASLTFHQPGRSRRSPSTRYRPSASSVTRGCTATNRSSSGIQLSSASDAFGTRIPDAV